MDETSMFPPSDTQSQTEGTTKKLDVVSGFESVCSGYVHVEAAMLPVRGKSITAPIVVRIDVEAMKRRKEIEETNESIRRRSGG